MKLTQLRWLAAAAVGSMFAVGCVVTTGGPVDPVSPSHASGPSKTKSSGKTAGPAAVAPATPAPTTPPAGPAVTGIAPPIAQTGTTIPAPPTAAPPAGTGASTFPPIARPPGIATTAPTAAAPPPTTTPSSTSTGKRLAVPTATSTGTISVPGKLNRPRPGGALLRGVFAVFHGNLRPPEPQVDGLARRSQHQLAFVTVPGDLLGPTRGDANQKDLARTQACLERAGAGRGGVAIRRLQRHASRISEGLFAKPRPTFSARAASATCAPGRAPPRRRPIAAPHERPTVLEARVQRRAIPVVASPSTRGGTGRNLRQGPAVRERRRVVATDGGEQAQPQEGQRSQHGSATSHTKGYRTGWTVRVECAVMRRSPFFLACALLGAATASCKTTSSTTPAPSTAASSAELPPPPPSGPSVKKDEKTPSGPSGSPGSVGTPPAGSAMVNGGTDVSGDRTLGEIAGIITKNRDKFRHCYDQAQAVNGSLKGRYLLVFELQPSGELKSARVDESASDIHDPGMDKCTVFELQRLRFPTSKQGKETKVSFPFTFTPGGAAKLARPRHARARPRSFLRRHRYREGPGAQRGQFPRRQQAGALRRV